MGGGRQGLTRMIHEGREREDVAAPVAGKDLVEPGVPAVVSEGPEAFCCGRRCGLGKDGRRISEGDEVMRNRRLPPPPGKIRRRGVMQSRSDGRGRDWRAGPKKLYRQQASLLLRKVGTRVVDEALQKGKRRTSLLVGRYFLGLLSRKARFRALFFGRWHLPIPGPLSCVAVPRPGGDRCARANSGLLARALVVGCFSAGLAGLNRRGARSEGA